MKVAYVRSTFAALGAVCLLAASPSSAELPSDVRAWMDESVKPCDDFYMHVCGNFIKNSPISEEKNLVDSTALPQDNLQATVDAILKDTNNEAGKLYASCMNTERIEKLGTAPLQAVLKKLDAIDKHDKLIKFAGKLSMEGTALFVNYDVGEHPKNATSNALILTMPELPVSPTTLEAPDFDFDAVSKPLSTFVVETLTATGDWEEQEVASMADRVIELISKFVPLYSSMDPSKWPQSFDELHPTLTLAEAKTKFPLLFGTFFSDVKPLINDVPVLVMNPKYFAEAEKIIYETDIEVLKAYVNFGIVQNNIVGMPEALRKAKFAATDALNGKKKPDERSVICAGLVTKVLPNTVGKLVFEAWKEEEGVKTTNMMLDSMFDIMEKRVHEVEWLSEETRKEAVKKLKGTVKLVGASDVAEELKFDEKKALLTNMERAFRRTFKAKLEAADKPVDRHVWQKTAADVNAYYNPIRNAVVIPVGYIQTPMFNATYHPVRNFAGLGAAVGHEITHGYDSKGRNFDENGSLRSWWTDADDAEFNQRSECFIEQYSAFKLNDDKGEYVINNNGNKTLGENIADNGGLKLARQGYKLFAEERTQTS